MLSLLSRCMRWLRRVPTSQSANLEALAAAFAYASPEYLLYQRLPGLGLVSDEDLCEGWRATGRALRDGALTTATIDALVVERRHYLDEFERRNESGFAAWLASGALGRDDPLPYLVEARDCSRLTDDDGMAIDWDELISGAD